MFGAGTDYCLLIVARFRDELRRTQDVGEAMTPATERPRPAIPSPGDEDRVVVVAAPLGLLPWAALWRACPADYASTIASGPS